MKNQQTPQIHEVYAATSGRSNLNGIAVPVVKDCSGANHHLIPLFEVCKINNINKMNRIFETSISVS